MLSETKTTFNGQTTGTTTIPYLDYRNYTVPCPHCHGVGHIHCSDCKKESACPECGGSGKKNVYQGSIYKIWWDTPVPYPYIEVTCKNSAPTEEHTHC